MWKFLSVSILLISTICANALAEEEPIRVGSPDEVTSEVKSVYVVPIQGAIGKASLYIVRRGIKDAISAGVDVIVIDMNTPGGELGVTLEIMKMLDRFDGETITFINNEAISAGAFISVITDKIYFQPDGQIGAAEVVSGTGQEIAEGMKRKLQSYINAKVRVYTEDYRYRGDIMRAMTDPDFELTIEETEFSKKGDLLSLTAKEAIQEYGDPAEKLLAEGLAESVEALLTHAYGEGNYEVSEFETTWSEDLAKGMQGVVPILMGLGMLLLFIEFKTPSFGVLGGLGIALIIVVFASNYVAGLAGYEVILLFFLGVVLVALELFLLPGTVFFGFMGIAIMLASMIWSLADIWPTVEGGFEWSWEPIIESAGTVLLSMAGSLVGLVVLWRFLPSKVVSQLVSQNHSPEPDLVTVGGAIHSRQGAALPEIGSMGLVTHSMHPLGTVEIEGQYFEAIASLGAIDKGKSIRVVGHRDFSLLVEEYSE